MPLCEEGVVTFILTLPLTFIAGPLGMRINFVCRISEMDDFFATYVILTAIVTTFSRMLRCNINGGKVAI